MSLVYHLLKVRIGKNLPLHWPIILQRNVLIKSFEIIYLSVHQYFQSITKSTI